MKGVVVDVLLGVGGLAVLLSCVGIAATKDPWDQLHFTGPATVVAPIALAAGVLVEEPLSAAGVKAVLVAVVMLMTGPALLHATARAARVREHGRFVVLSREAERKEKPSTRSSR